MGRGEDLDSIYAKNKHPNASLYDLICAFLSLEPNKFRKTRQALLGEIKERKASFVKVDFDRKVIKRIAPKEIEFENPELFNRFDQVELADVLTLLGNQYNIIATILGIKVGSEGGQYIFKAKTIMYAGQFIPPYLKQKGSVNFNQSELLLALEKKARNMGLLSKEFLLVHIIFTIAHELYHARQHYYSPIYFFRRAEQERGLPQNDYTKYKKQHMELGANIFAQKYLVKLVNAVETSPPLRDAVRRYLEIIGNEEDYNNFIFALKFKKS